MEIHQYVGKMKEINNSLLNFLDDLNCEEIEEFNNSNEKYEMLLKSIKEHNIDEDRYELIDFIRLIVSIANNHHRLPNFFAKLEKNVEEDKSKVNKICRKCMRESIKCHHNEIANYFKSNYIDEESQMDNYSIS